MLYFIPFEEMSDAEYDNYIESELDRICEKED